jgi:hypothetical protein
MFTSLVRGSPSDTTVSQNWLNAVVGRVEQDEYKPSLQTLDVQGKPFTHARYHFANRAQNLRAYFDEQGMELMPRVITEQGSWTMNYCLSAVYREEAKSQGHCIGSPVINDNAIVYDYHGLSVAYTNSEQGILEHIVLQERLPGSARLTIQSLVQSTHNDRVGVRLVTVEDANHRTVSGSLIQDLAHLGISIDDNRAEYPISVQVLMTSQPAQVSETQAMPSYERTRFGLSQTPDWIQESNQASAFFGYSVSTAGDVNGDGYSDVIVGAYSFDNGQSNEGRAFVFHGSSSGVSTTTTWSAESDNASASFGYSVSTAGDVNGDGYSDVLVGAYNYTNGQTEEGRAYVFHGSSSGLSTTADWTRESNVASAYFGNAVSTAGDVNGDGYSDIIVGAYGYTNGQNKEGRAYVFHGSSSGLSTTANWTVESNLALAAFGTSVSGAGDVNSDGYADAIVGSALYTTGDSHEGRAFV